MTYYNMCEYYDKHVYEPKEHDPRDFKCALEKIRQWDYNSDSRIPLGVLYKREAPTFDEAFAKEAVKLDRAATVGKILEEAL